MKLAVLGGSFNPVHIGHLMLADTAHCLYGYDKIAFIPAFLSPFKQHHVGCSADDRIEMIRAAIADNNSFYCETCEINRGGISYTVDTIRYLYRNYSGIEGNIGLIMGDDTAVGLSCWKDAELLSGMVDILVGSRMNIAANVGTENCYSFLRMSNAVLPISSTQIRAAIAKKANWRYFVHPAVYSYIMEHALYA